MMSVELKGLTKFPGLLDEFNWLDLSYEEQVVVLFVLLVFLGVLKQLLEMGSIYLTRHECWREMWEEGLGELSVTSRNDFCNHRVVLVKVGSDEVKLLLSLLEAGHLVADIVKRIRSGFINDLIPQLLFESRVWQWVVTNLAALLGLVTGVILECLRS